MGEKKVTIVLPIYNVEKYLNRSVESVIRQTYKNLEIILVDDESPDSCPKMCDEWKKKDKRIKVVHKKNAGLGMARNTGIENATGDYICFLDSDDYIEQNTIEKVVSSIEESNADVALFGFNDVDKFGNIVQTFVPNTPKYLYIGSEIQRELLPNIISLNEMNLMCSALDVMDLLDARNFFLLFWIFTDKLFVRFASNTSSGGKSSIEKNLHQFPV